MSPGRARTSARRPRPPPCLEISDQPQHKRALVTTDDPAESILTCRVGVYWPGDDRYYRVRFLLPPLLCPAEPDHCCCPVSCDKSSRSG